jgi:molybdopterin-guanine dinucleotide biosynthesis protein A
MTTEAPVGVLLAGGLARRMGGGDKGLRTVGGVPILQRVADRLRPQVATLIVNANGDPARFSGLGAAVVPDDLPDRPGPLAGVLAALDWAAAHAPGATHVVSAPTDGPFLPPDLVARLEAARRAGGVPLACARSDGQAHPVVALWAVALRDDLRRALAVEGLRKIDAWTARHGIAHADWPVDPWDPFFNVNSPEELAAAEAVLAAHPGA